MLTGQFEHAGSYERKQGAQVVAVLGKQPHSCHLSACQNPEAVMLNFVQPIRPKRAASRAMAGTVGQSRENGGYAYKRHTG
jgi:hypothetical protein